VDSHPDALIHKASIAIQIQTSGRRSSWSGRFTSLSGRLSVFDKLQDFFPKHSYGKIDANVRTMWIPIRMHSFIRQVSQFKSRRPDDGPHGPDVFASYMEIACIKSTVRMIIPLVRTREAFIRKLLAADVRPSERQYLTVRTQLSNRKDLERNFQNFGCTVVHPDGAQLYQARCSFEPSAYK
jgi:hypothetical protein